MLWHVQSAHLKKQQQLLLQEQHLQQQQQALPAAVVRLVKLLCRNFKHLNIVQHNIACLIVIV